MLLIVRFGRTLSVQCVSRVDVNPPVFRFQQQNAIDLCHFWRFACVLYLFPLTLQMKSVVPRQSATVRYGAQACDTRRRTHSQS